MEYLKVKNWEKFQHYKRRGTSPPWIKVYTKLLDDEDFENLPDASKLQLLLIWLLTARTGRWLPNDEGYITKKLQPPLYGCVNLRVLIDTGFLVLTNDSMMLSSCYTQEKRKEEKRREEKPRLFPIKGKTCSVCNLPAVYKDSSGMYDHYYCAEHMPQKVKEVYK